MMQYQLKAGGIASHIRDREAAGYKLKRRV
jgi:hypothetical protein